MNLKRRLERLESAVSIQTAQHDPTYGERVKNAILTLLQQKAARYYAAPDQFRLEDCSLVDVCTPHCFTPDGAYNPAGELVLRALLQIDPADQRQCEQFKRQYAPG